MNWKEHIQAPHSKPTPPHTAADSRAQHQTWVLSTRTCSPHRLLKVKPRLAISNLLLAWRGGLNLLTIICLRFSQKGRLLFASY